MSIDRNSPTWKAVKAELEGCIVQDLRELESPADPIRTANLRGRIAVCRSTLKLADDQPVIVDSPNLY
jgi:hypothetical protein